MTILELAVPQGEWPAGPQYCPICGRRLRLLTRYFRISSTEGGDALIEFADPAAGWKGKRTKQFRVHRDNLQKGGLELHGSKTRLSRYEQDVIMRLWLQGIKDLHMGWRWLRDSTTVWYEHPLPRNSSRPYIRISSMPSTFGNWVAPLYATMYICGYSYADIAKEVGIDTKNRGTVAAAIKSLIKKTNISLERLSKAHARTQAAQPATLRKSSINGLVTDSLTELDEVWLRVLGPTLGLVVDNQHEVST